MTTVFEARPFWIQPIEQTADVVIDGLHAGEVILQVTLVFPGIEGLAGKSLLVAVGLDLDFGRFDVEPLVAGGAAQSGRRLELEVSPSQVVEHLLRAFADGVGAGRVIVTQRRRLGNLNPGEHCPVPVIRVPGAVRGLVVAHEEKGPVLGAVVQEINRQVGDNIGDIALHDAAAFGREKGGVVINALAGQNGPLVEAGGVAAQVPLADHPGVIARRLEVLGHRGLGTVEAVEGRHAVEVAVLAGEDGGAAGAADGIDAKAVCKPDTAAGQAIEVWGVVDSAAISADRVRRVVVAHNEQDVGPALPSGQSHGPGHDRGPGQ